MTYKFKEDARNQRRKYRQRLEVKQARREEQKKYRKTFHGFLSFLYKAIRYRVSNANGHKAHLYYGLELLPREEFMLWAKTSVDLAILFDNWKKSNYSQKLTPSVDRKDTSKGYTLDNMRWITNSENSRLGSIARNKLPYRTLNK